MRNLKNENNKTRYFILLTYLLAAIFIFGTLYIYIRYFGVTISSDHMRWAEFGAFLGGLMTPLFSFLSLTVVLFVFVGERYNKKRDNEDRNIKFYLDELDNSLIIMTNGVSKYLGNASLNTYDAAFSEYFRISRNFIEEAKKKCKCT